MANGSVSLPQQRGFGETLRKDAWWLQPALVFLGFLAFLVWANFRVFENNYYYSGYAANNAATNYLTPFYSPLMFDVPKSVTEHGPSGHAWLRAKPAWMPAWLSAAAWILIFPAGFRFTCYYYRGAYYKAFWADPPNCAVGEPRKTYWGERTFPLILQNIHRYFMYAAIVFIVILAYDVWEATRFHKLDAAGKATGEFEFGIGLGTILLAVNVVLIALYTFGCHSLRHLIGGGRDLLSTRPASYKAYQCVSCLNRRHMLYAWLSLFAVGFADIYVRLCAMGVWTDPRLL